MQRSRIVVVAKALLLMLTILCCGVMTQYVSAQAQPVKTEKGLTVSPLRTEITIDPGTSQEGSLTVTNETDAQLTVRFNVEEFNVTNQQYDYAFTTGSDITKWVTYSADEVDLAVGESKKVGYIIGVPLTAEPGGRYISLFASTTIEQTMSGVASIQRIGSLLYVTLNGEVTRAGALVSLTSQLLVNDTSTWSAVVQNSGSTHYRSKYIVTTQNLFGALAAPEVQGSALILPGTVRLVQDELPVPRFPGIYKTSYIVGLGDSPVTSEMRLMVYAPVYVQIIVGALIIAAVTYVFIRLTRKSVR